MEKIEIIKKHLKLLDDERQKNETESNEIRKRISSLNNELYKDEKKFKCHRQLSNTDALCPECPNLLPDISNGWDAKKSIYRVVTLTSNRMESEFSITREQYCKEWMKKKTFSACGCGGMVICQCGYSESYCGFQDRLSFCPFCKRPTKNHLSPITQIVKGA